MYRQAIRPLARYPLTAATTTVRGLSTLPLRRVGQPTAAKGVVATLDAHSRPRISPLSAQAAIFKRLYATEETTEKANHPGRSNVEFQHTTTGAREEVGFVCPLRGLSFSLRYEALGLNALFGGHRLGMQPRTLQRSLPVALQPPPPLELVKTFTTMLPCRLIS